MKQLLQNYKTGKMEVTEVPDPSARPGGILVANHFSLISAGTERMKVEQARASLLGKARARPDMVKKVLAKVRTEGLMTTWTKVQAKLDQPTPLGYSTAGSVLEVGSDVEEFQVGTRVACAGAEYANHAELIYVPHNLAVAIPENVTYEEAAFTTLGAIAMQGVRQAQPQLGDTVCVIGLGLLGQLTVQMLKACGCRVLGVDISEKRCELARSFGAEIAMLRSEDVVGAAHAFTRGAGVDIVMITAAGEQNNDPIELSAEVTRDRAKVVIVGMVKMDVPRRVFYDKELSISLARSYGPGRYDPVYEEMGIDYPIGYVRWTERENMRQFLQMISDKTVDVISLTTHQFKFDDAIDAYNLLTGPDAGSAFGVLLEYDAPAETRKKRIDIISQKPSTAGKVKLGVIGAGSFCVGTLLPNLKSLPDVEFVGVATARGLSAKSAAERFGFAYAASERKEILQDANINTVLIATRHSSHAPQVCEALNAGKAVFVEKPLSLDEEGLRTVSESYKQANKPLMVGFNRRFAPMVLEMKSFFKHRQGPMMLNYRVNAGAMETKNWMRASDEGGSRLVSEGCHFIDTMLSLTGSMPVSVYAANLTKNPEPDTGTCIINFADGSIGTLTYITNGDSTLPKERLEVHADGSSAVLDDFRKLHTYQREKHNEKSSAGQDKGHRAELTAFIVCVKEGKPLPMTFEEIAAVTLVTFGMMRSASTGCAIEIDVSPYL